MQCKTNATYETTDAQTKKNHNKGTALVKSVKNKLITKTCLYNVDLSKPHIYIVKLVFTGVYIIFLISARNIGGYSLEPPRRGGSNEYHNLCFEQKYEKYQNFYLKIFIFGGKIFSMFE